MSELSLNPSETRAARPTRVASTVLRPLVLAGLGAGALAGVAVAASTFIGDLLAPPARSAATVRTVPPAVQSGLASQWPDLKDGLPAVAGAAVKTVAAASDSAPKVEPLRMAALSNPPSTIPGLGAVTPAPSVPQAPTAKAEPPTKRIPVPTSVATLAPPAATKPVMPTRTAALVPPRETVRAQDETAKPDQDAAKRSHDVSKPVQEAAKRPTEVTKPRQEVAKAREDAPRTREAVAKPATPRPNVEAAATVAEKSKKVAAAHKAAPHTPDAAKPTVVASASADAEETDILGVKLPSLAPAGRKLRDGVTALGDAVRNAF